MTDPPERVFDYPHDPGRLCDIVMKGGITSGVVYPLAICRLAEKFRLQNIGGTSAGAIAAAVAAAAEYSRRNGGGRGFEVLEQLPERIGAPVPGSDDSTLFHLFQPTRKTRPLFALLVAAISNPPASVPFELAFSALWNWRRWALAGAAPGLLVFVLAFLSLAPDAGALSVATLGLGLLASTALALLGALLAVAFAARRGTTAALAGNWLGVCSGMSQDTAPTAPGSGARPPALTEWLHALIAETSGVPVLTFGDLWKLESGRGRDIDLTMITTCLTFGRPYTLPLAVEESFFFDEAELRNLFPAAVVDHLVATSSEPPLDERYRPLPPPQDLPVVFAARLSLSFPVLLSAIPLYHLNEEQEFIRCVFSDGGICSNFPIESFDSPLPRWPTFGIDLAGPVGADGVDVWMPDSNFVTIPRGDRRVDGVGALLGSIRGAMQNWHDNRYVELFGYRDRIVHVRFREGEGGLNLNMPRDLIELLADRGDRAGAELAARFTAGTTASGDATELTWNNHRHVRLRSALGALEAFAIGLAVGYTGEDAIATAPRTFVPFTPPTDENGYAAIAGGPLDPPGRLQLDPAQRAVAVAVLDDLVALARDWAERIGSDVPVPSSPSLRFGVPNPAPTLRAGPRL